MYVRKFHNKRTRQLNLSKYFKNDYDPEFQDKNLSVKKVRSVYQVQPQQAFNFQQPPQLNNQHPGVFNNHQVQPFNNIWSQHVHYQHPWQTNTQPPQQTC